MPRYTLLRLIGVLYRMLAYLSFLTTTGAVIYSAVTTLQNTPLNQNPFDRGLAVVIQAVPVITVGFVLMITFYTFSQIIDLLVTLAANMRLLIDEQHNRPPTSARTSLPGRVSAP